MAEETEDNLQTELMRAMYRIQRSHLLGPHPRPRHPIRRSEMMFLMILTRLIQEQPEGVRASDLSAQMNITKSAVTHQINSLEKMGFIERVADGTDRRLVLITMTEQGQDFVQKVERSAAERMGRLISFLGEQDTKEAIRLLGRLATFIEDLPSEKQTDEGCE